MIVSTEQRTPSEPIQLIASGCGGTPYNVVRCGATYFAIHQADGEFDAARVAAGTYRHTVFAGSSIADVATCLGVPVTAEQLVEPPPPGPAPISTDNFLELAFSSQPGALAHAILQSVANARRVLLIGRPERVDEYAWLLRNDHIEIDVADWNRPHRNILARDAVALFCEAPENAEEWELFREWSEATGGALDTIWGKTLPYAAIVALQQVFDYNSPTLEGMTEFYTARAFHAPNIRRLPDLIPIEGKTIVEFGPSDGVNTGALLSFGARQITAIEARPENVLKLLAAKFAFGWTQVEIVADNFHGVLPEQYGRFDIAFAHGVYEHSNSPLVFLDNLTRLSDVIVIGGWCATNETPSTRWEEWSDRGKVYRGKTFAETSHFLSGMQSRSVYLDHASLEGFFSDRSYECRPISVEHISGGTGLFVRFVAMKD